MRDRSNGVTLNHTLADGLKNRGEDSLGKCRAFSKDAWTVFARFIDA